MISDQQGGIISKMFIIPAGVVVIIAVFVAGYYVGKRQGAEAPTAEKPPALPEVLSQYLPAKDDLTFYKTLTEKGEKAVSIDLKPRPKTDAPAQQKKESAAAGPAMPSRPSATASGVSPARQAAAKGPVQTAKKEPARTETAKVRYTLQVGSYEDRSVADEEVRGMKKRGYAAFVVATDIREKGTWYRVRVGSFANKQAAERLAGELKAKEGITSFITTE